ncbi:hypothetical protein [Thauera sp. Sel9]|uniref:hypothetical protein n=1 Tax=Thauera sp. Sel9 TaxID=2974299 RepID=UPI0021E0FE3B|nr:hypothetical protein [Thauera sp. Sel9]MCV2218102.1 hypothetical protein [Thauera sp. Sel9]
MHFPSPRRARSEGFILLHALWLLLVATTLAVGAMTAVFHSAEELSISEQRLRTRLVHESAVEVVIHDLLINGDRSAWIGAGIIFRSMQIDQQILNVSVQQVNGLINPVTSDPAIFGRLLAGLAIPQGQQKPGFAAPHPSGVFRPATYADLQAMLGLDDGSFACLYPYVTLYSGRTEPDLRYAPNRLAKLAGLRPSASSEARSVMSEDGVPGSTFRVNVFAESAPDDTSGFSVEVTITGQIEPSHLVRSRQRIIGASNKLCPF